MFETGRKTLDIGAEIWYNGYTMKTTKRSQMTKTERIIIRVSPRFAELTRAAAAQRGMDMSSFIRYCVTRYQDRHLVDTREEYTT